MNTDPIADYLTRIRNAHRVSHSFVEVPASKLKVELSKLLQREGYIQSFEIFEGNSPKDRKIRINLKYDQLGYPVIRKIKRESRPGLRKYFRSQNIPRILDGGGISVVTTSRGLMTDRQAKRERVGGELLCTLY